MTSSIRTRRSRRRRAALALVGVASLAAATGLAAAADVHAGSTPDLATLMDDTDLLRVDVPLDWTDVDTAPETRADGSTGARIAASPDLAAFLDGYAETGLIYTALDYTADSKTGVTEAYNFTGICTDGGIEPYSDSYFLGNMQTWTDCDGTSTKIVTVLAAPLDRAFSVLLLVQVPTATEEADLQTILDTFYVVAPTTAQVTDDTGTLSVSVPVPWGDVDTTPDIGENGAPVPRILAATDSAGLIAGTFVPSVTYLALPYTEDLAIVLASYPIGYGCTDSGVTDYSDPYFVGVTQEWANCDGGTGRVVTVAANPPDLAFTAYLQVTLPTAADEPGLNVVLDSFYIGSGSPTSPPIASAPQPSITPTTLTPVTPPPPPPVTVPVATAAPVPAPEPVETGFVTVTDDTNTLIVAVPQDWSAVLTAPRDEGSGAGVVPNITASPPEDGAISGLIYSALPYDADLRGSLDANVIAGCVDAGVVEYSDGYFTGLIQTWQSCAGGQSTIVTVFANPPDAAFTASLQISAATPDDEAAIGTILNSFYVVNPAVGG